MRRRLDFAFGVPLIALLALVQRARTRDRPASVRAGARRRVLVIKLAAVGDTILLVPALRAIRKALPEARLDWLVSSTNEAVARTVPYVDHLYVMRRTVRGIVRVLRTLRPNAYDVVIDAEQWARGTALISYLTGAPRRVGFSTPGQHRAALFTRAHVKTFAAHEVDEFLRLFSLVAPLEFDRSLELWDTPGGLLEAATFLDSPIVRQATGPLVLFHPGCGADGGPREWPLESYAALGRRLQQSCGATLLLTSGPEETHKTAALNDLLDGTAHDLGGRLTWPGLIAVLRHVDLAVSGNTGVMHVAAALQLPQIALHGPTNPLLWGPVNPNAVVVQSTCSRCPCLRLGFEYHDGGPSCMRSIPVDAVCRAATGVLAGCAPSGTVRSAAACTSP